ncbi:MAG: hypothetical protein KTR21_05550 [Rhodobacteraceae bacterium]|nr:hypothetical protein [Paracoccaceae bacterium]
MAETIYRPALDLTWINPKSGALIYRNCGRMKRHNFAVCGAKAADRASLKLE